MSAGKRTRTAKNFSVRRFLRPLCLPNFIIPAFSYFIFIYKLLREFNIVIIQ